MRRPLAALALLLAFVPGAALAQHRSAARSSSPSREHAVKNTFGIPVALRLLQSDDILTRVRGVERLAAMGTPEAFDALTEALDGSGAAMRDVRVRLTAVRVLAGETRRDNVRQILLREVTDTGSDGRGPLSPLSSVLRGSAALALARGGDRKAVAALASALIRPGPAADAAAAALRVYPPESLDVFTESKRPTPAGADKEKDKDKPPGEPAPESKRKLSPQQATFLGEIGDMRAIERLRALIAEGETAAKAAAVPALARLGDEAALPLSREWAKKADPKLRVAAAEALTALGADDAPAAVAALFELEQTREDGLRLALRAPSTELVAPLAKLLPTLPVEAQPRAVAALGRARAAAELAPLLDKPESATQATFALATMPGDEARAALEKALSAEAAKGEHRRLLLRAGTVRALVLDDAPSGLKGALKALWKGTDPSDRAAAAFALTALGWLSLSDAVEAACKGSTEAELRCDTALLGAAARGALALPDGAGSLAPLLPVLTRLARAAREAAPLDEALLAAAGAALLTLPDGGDLPTPVLAVWAEAGGPIAPLAARALPSRDDETMRGRIRRLLEGSDPVVRAHVALGLARDPQPDAVALLAKAYRFEEDAGVRRAVVRALSRRTEPQRLATLTVARDLDPDEDVRALARAALDGRDLEPRLRLARGPEPRRSVAWVTVRSFTMGPRAAPNPALLRSADAMDARAASDHALLRSAESAGKSPGLRAARVVRPDGLAVPVVADPDGVLLVPGLPSGPATLLLARP